MPFTPDQVAILDQNADLVECRRLLELTLAGETFRFVEGQYEITTSDGRIWQPGLPIIAASAIQRGEAFQAIPAEYVVAGLPESPTQEAEDAFADMAFEVMQNPDSWFGGTVHQYLQMMVDGAAVGPIISLHRGWIKSITPQEDARTASFKLEVESIFARRDRTPLGEYTDRDQQRRHPGDKGCEFTPTFSLKTIKGWPF